MGWQSGLQQAQPLRGPQTAPLLLGWQRGAPHSLDRKRAPPRGRLPPLPVSGRWRRVRALRPAGQLWGRHLREWARLLGHRRVHWLQTQGRLPAGRRQA